MKLTLSFICHYLFHTNRCSPARSQSRGLDCVLNKHDPIDLCTQFDSVQNCSRKKFWFSHFLKIKIKIYITLRQGTEGDEMMRFQKLGTVRSFTMISTFLQTLLRLSRRMEGAVSVGHVETIRCVCKILVETPGNKTSLERCCHNVSVILISGS
jgi:hypothetical protein